MIKKTEETKGGGSKKGKIASFKKFSDMKNKSKSTEGSDNSVPENIFKNPPANPNVPSDTRRRESTKDTNSMMPIKDKKAGELIPDDAPKTLKVGKTDEKVKFHGKIAKLPDNVKASSGINLLEKVKISKDTIWYIIVEKDLNSELQIVKYNYKAGVNLSKFVNDLKGYYLKRYEGDEVAKKLIESIKIDGNDKFSMIKNIPLVEIDGKKMISKITEDLIKLLGNS